MEPVHDRRVAMHTEHFKRLLSDIVHAYDPIPEDDYERIEKEVGRSLPLPERELRVVLRALHMQKYYDNIPYIEQRLSSNVSVAPYSLPADVESSLVTLYSQARAAHHRKSPMKDISPAYIAHKLLQLMGKHEYLQHFPLLNSLEKRNRQEAMWQAVCDDTGWQFIASSLAH